MESLDIYPDLNNISSLYAATWIRDSYGWAWRLNYLNNKFVEQLNSLGNQGFRITDIEFEMITIYLLPTMN